MKLGIVSDTHGHVPFTLEAVRMLEAMEVERVIHCGDIGSTDIPRLFAAWPTDYVLGNVDDDVESLAAAIEAVGHQLHGRFGEIELMSRRIAILHGDDMLRFQQVLRSGSYHLICYGHTHQASSQTIGITHLLNPGAVYRGRPRSIAVVELPSCEATTIPLT